MTTLSLRVLGALAATVDERVVTLGGPVPRALLARLVIAGGAMVPDDVLIDDLWRSAPPRTARVTVQGYVAALRRSMEPGRGAGQIEILVRRGVGYAVDIGHLALDADEFDRLARLGRERREAGDPADAVEALSAALALWSGPAYADVRDWEFASAESERLSELRLDVTEDHLFARSDCGDQSGVTTDAGALVAEAPLRERGWEVLALAHYRAGRQGLALATLDQARRVLADELGVDLGPGLAALQRSVLDHDPDLLVAPTASSGPVEVAGSRTSNNLPIPLTSMVGRAGVIADLSSLLDRHRLITVRGPGGMGKTRTAIEVARAREDDDGPWLVELADVADAATVINALTSAIGVTVAGGVDSVAAAIGQRSMVVVLDNCEHLLDEVAAVIVRLLGGCPKVRFLATSREAIGVAGELVYDLGPLDAGASLFVDRAGRFADDDELTDIDALCAALDNLPLAIELAAAQCATLSVRQILDRLDDRFTVLRSGRRGSTRHATMRAAIDGSYAQLDAPERDLFADLSVFEGGFDLDAIGAVTARPAALAELDGLVAKSLVQVIGGDPRRYRMLETIRGYARESLTAVRHADVVAAHREWVDALCARAYVELRTAHSARWTDRLDADMPNVRATLARAAADGTPAGLSTQLRLAGNVYWFWFRRGHVAEGSRWLRPALDAGDDVDLAVRIRAVAGLAIMSYLGSDIPTLLGALGRLGELFDQTDPGSTDQVALIARADAAVTMGFFQCGAGLLDEGRAHARIAADIARTVQADRTVAEAMMALGTADFRGNQFASAAKYFEDGLAVARGSGYDWCAASILWIHAKAEIAQGHIGGAAERRLAEMVDHCDRSADVTSWMVAVFTLAYTSFLRGEHTTAADLIGVVDWHTELTGYSPEAMDVVELARYGAEMRAAIDADTLATGVVRGRDMSRESVRQHFTRQTGLPVSS